MTHALPGDRMSDDRQRRPHEPRRSSGLILGLVFLVIGGLFLAINLGAEVPQFVWEYWMYYPVILIALGVIGIITPSRHLRRSGGIWFLAAGIYCLIGTFHLFSLGWGSAWPIFIIAHGLNIIFVRRDRF